MPIPTIISALAAPALQAGATLIGNKINTNYAKAQIQQQREWALSDWDKVQAYNHPTQQMARYKEAGLNPHLIYGNGTNSPASMVRSTDAPPPRIDTSGITEGIGNASNSYIALKKLENDTALTQAQILSLGASTAKKEQDVKLVQEQWKDLIMSPFFSNLSRQAGIQYTDAQRNTLPTREMALERYAADTAKSQTATDVNRANASRFLELLETARKQNKLTQGDIDMLENLGGSPKAVQWGYEILKMILGEGMHSIPRSKKVDVRHHGSPRPNSRRVRP